MSFYKKREWLITGILGAVAFVLAFIGFNTYFVENGIQRNFLDLIFHSIKIFGMELVDEYASPLPITLEIARWLAPGVLLFTAVKGIIYLVRREFKLMKARGYKNHIIVSGLNENSTFLVNDLLNKNEKVILVSTESDEAKKEVLERSGAVVISGKLSEVDVLKMASANKARYFILMEEDDEKNLSDAVAIHTYLKEYNNGTKPVIHTHVASYMKLNELKEIGFFNNIKKTDETELNYEIKIFSKNERTARLLMKEFSPDVFRPIVKKDDEALKVAVFGSGELVQSMITYIAALGHYVNNRKVKVSLFHEDHKTIENLKQYSPGLEELIELKNYENDLDIFDINIFAELQKESPFDAIYLLCDDDGLSLKMLNKLCKVKFDKKIDVVLALNKHDGVLNKWYAADHIGNISLHKFNLTEETFTKEGIVSEKIDELAKVIHNDYFGKVKERNKVDDKKGSHREWEYLSEDFKNQNRMQADHIMIKLRSAGCTTAPLNSPEAEYDFTTNKEIVELFSEMEHNRWAAHMLLNGWKYGPERDEVRKLHTDLIPYEELSDGVKQYDRDTIKNIPMLLKKLSLKVIKENK